jgi:hypothetical protein
VSTLHSIVLQFLVIVSHIIECHMLADEKVKENEAVHALHERAKMIVDMELQHPVCTILLMYTPFSLTLHAVFVRSSGVAHFLSVHARGRGGG